MAELVCDDALEFRSIEFLERSTRHRDGGIGRRQSRRERVDTLFFFENEDIRYRNPRRDCHLFHDIEQTLAQRILGFARYFCRAEHPGDLRAAPRERCCAVETGQQNEQRGERGNAGQ